MTEHDYAPDAADGMSRKSDKPRAGLQTGWTARSAGRRQSVLNGKLDQGSDVGGT